MKLLRLLSFLLIFGVAVFTVQAEEPVQVASENNPTNLWPCYILKAEKIWQLNPPNGERFDASALLLKKNGDLLTVNDRGASIYQIKFGAETNAANLVLISNCFTEIQLAPFAKDKMGRYDTEGLAEDSTHRLYTCEEANRWIMRFDPKKQTVERLDIDWSPVKQYFHPTDHNASFEGIAIGKGKLYVANERQSGRIIVVDLRTKKITDDFTVRPSKTKMRDIHYSDLCWFEDCLFALLRENRVLVKINPQTHQILGEYNFNEMEQQPDNAYLVTYPTSTFEGVAVDKGYFWFVTDNNGFPRRLHPEDSRPTLFKCIRPDL